MDGNWATDHVLIKGGGVRGGRERSGDEKSGGERGGSGADSLVGIDDTLVRGPPKLLAKNQGL